VEQRIQLGKRMVGPTIKMLLDLLKLHLPAKEFELIGKPDLRTTRFDEDALEYELTIKFRPKK
jgi:hypothetical protein